MHELRKLTKQSPSSLPQRNDKPKAYQYQKQVVYQAERFGGRALISLEMGLGKTLISLWLLKRQRIDSWPALVVCPASMKYVWASEAVRIGIPYRIVGSRDAATYRMSGHLTIVNYDVLPQWSPIAIQHGVKTLVLDEVQYCKNRRAKRTKAAQALARRVRHVIALSGTPLMNRPADLWPTLNMLRPDLFRSFWKFAFRYCDPKRTRWGWDIKGASHLDELHRLLSDGLMVRLRKEDVLPDLPEKTRAVVPVDLPNMTEYVRARDDFLRWLEEQDPKKARSAKRAPSLAKIGYLLRLCGSQKTGAVIDWCNDFLEGSDEKLVVFAIHKDTIRSLDNGIKGRHVIVDGSISMDRRQKAVQSFQTDPSIRVFIGNIHAAGVGLTLTAASTVVFAELYWRPTDLVQAEDRCHRIGTTKPVWCYYLVARNTLEEIVAKVIQEKQSIIRTVLDGQAVSDVDLFDLLLDELRKDGLAGTTGKSGNRNGR